MNDTFESKGGEQNIVQRENAIGKQVNNYFRRLLGRIFTTGNQSPAIVAGGNVAVTYGMSLEEAAKLARDLVGPLLEAKDQQIKALTEAITALSKTGAPAASINDALQALQQGDTAKAQAVFAEVLRTKEAEGRQANKEAAAAARHLGALAYLHDTNGALTAYRKAVELDPDNADGWNRLGHLLHRTGELEQAEATYRKVLALGEAHQDKEEQAAALGNLGLVHKTRGDLDKAEEMHKKSLALHEALGSKEGMAADYANLGSVYKQRGDLAQAEAAWKKSLSLYQEMGAMQHSYAKKVQQWLDDLAQQKSGTRR